MNQHVTDVRRNLDALVAALNKAGLLGIKIEFNVVIDSGLQARVDRFDVFTRLNTNPEPDR